jgi:hypothetical protein
VCGATGASHRFDILKESGGSAIHTCEECSRLGERLAIAVKDTYCLWCLEPASTKYSWLSYGSDDGPRHRICGGCREEIIFSERPLSRRPREVES